MDSESFGSLGSTATSENSDLFWDAMLCIAVTFHRRSGGKHWIDFNSNEKEISSKLSLNLQNKSRKRDRFKYIDIARSIILKRY
jgi:hypothetical protein